MKVGLGPRLVPCASSRARRRTRSRLAQNVERGQAVASCKRPGVRVRAHPSVTGGGVARATSVARCESPSTGSQRIAESGRASRRKASNTWRLLLGCSIRWTFFTKSSAA